MRDKIINDYFKWLSDLVCGKRYSRRVSYRKLLMHLHNIEFRYLIPNDKNRADDGVNLRYQFSLAWDDKKTRELIADSLDGPCSVLEMMVALCLRCETNIMDDPTVGDRTGQWFWGMIVNLGLGSMSDSKYNKHTIDDVINRFLDRDYDPDGKGGLFTIKHCNRDLRDVEIWYQLCWYLDSIT